MSDPAPPPSIADIFLVFLRIGLLSFGGGLTGWVYREAVLLRRWIDEDEFMSGVAMSQILPGANITNLSVYIGQKMHGLPGACAAFMGLLSGPFFAVLALAAAYGAIRSLPYVEAAMDGIAAAAIGLLFVVAARGARRATRSPAAFAALLATFAGVGLLHLSLPIVVAVIGPLSVLAAWFRSRDRAQ
ncbi:MAG TPA: chromate transporter [Pseudolabrys sp.]|nr:chromate transporter [Pseudolabrys sp.]